MKEDDFLGADISELMRESTEQERAVDVNAILTDYDRDLMAFRPTARRRAWPEPIRKRV